MESNQPPPRSPAKSWPCFQPSDDLQAGSHVSHMLPLRRCRAALQGLVRAYVPDDRSAVPAKESSEAAAAILGRLVALVNPNEEVEEFEDFGWVLSFCGPLSFLNP